MKHSKKIDLATVVAVGLPLLLIVPNIGLCITERMGFLSALTNVLLPWSVYSLLMSLWKRTGVTTLLMLPFMIYAAFQIVLLYLYGGSIIAVDMFLNVVTTNPTEVSELLGNLVLAIALVVILYIPPLVCAIVMIIRRKFLHEEFMKKYRRFSLWATGISVILLIVTMVTVPRYRILKDLFPANVIANMCRAVKRGSEVTHYEETSRDFTYNAVSRHPEETEEVYMLVIGETSRGESWQLLGYERENNPRLSELDSLIVFKKAVTQSNTTHKSVPMLMSSLTAENFDSIGYHKSIFTAFKEAGFQTYLFSNQTRNRSYTEHFCNEADRQEYIKDDLGRYAMDHSLLDYLDEALADTIHKKKFIILHTYGSHFNYKDRYTKEFSKFKPDEYVDANPVNRDKLVNAFDNTILYTDSFLAEAIEKIKAKGVASAVIYTSDHGEDIFDDERQRFLHASPTPTFHQLYVPLFVWLSDDYNRQFGGDAYANILGNSSKAISPTEAVFPTLISLAGISTPYLNPEKSLDNKEFKTTPLLYVTDLNEAVPLRESGIREYDIELFEGKQIDL